MEEGDVVEIDYVGRVKESGELFDTTKRGIAEEENAVNERAKYEPVKVVVGAEMLVEGLDEALLDMEVGGGGEVEVPPEKGFGSREGDLIKTFSEKKFKDVEMNPYPGMRVNLDGKMGRILSVNSGRVRVDLNHPLAGRTLNYEVEINKKIEGTEEQVAAVIGYYLGEDPDVEVEGKKATVEVPEKLKDEALEKFEDIVKEHLDIEEIDFKKVEEDEPEGKTEESE